MNPLKYSAAMLLAILLLPQVAASADPAAEACRKGQSCFEKQDYDAAIAAFTTAIRIDPKDAEAYYFRGLAFQKKGQQAKADEDFARAKKLGYKAK